MYPSPSNFPYYVNLIRKKTNDTDPTINVCWGGDTMIRKLSVVVRPHNHCIHLLGMLGPLIANYHSVILMGAGLSVGDLEFMSPLCPYQLTKYSVRRNVGAAPGPCHGDL